VSGIARFDPAGALRTLTRHRVDFVVIGGYAAVLHGSPVFTVDADVCPSRDPANLRRLCAALHDMDARLRTVDHPDGVEFRCDEHLLAQMLMLNLVTRYGDFDLSFRPAASNGYDDLARRSVEYDIGGCVVKVAAVDDIIVSKESVNREKDKIGLVHLYALRDEIGRQQQERRR
jgi:hypothetical protein